MANKIKTGLDYFPLEVGIFSDIKCRKLMRSYGTNGLTFYIYLLCRIYEDGYYIELDDDLLFFAAETLRIDEILVNEMLNFMLKIGIFDENLAREKKILTSKGVQIRYSEISKIARRKKTIENFSLINVQEYPINAQDCTNNVQEYPINVHFCNKEKERKGKESKVKEKVEKRKSKMLTTSTSSSTEIFELKKNNYVCVDELYEILSNDDYWIEISAKSHQTEIDEIQIAIPKFLLHLQSSGTEIKSIQDAKSHFNNWLRKIRQIEPKSNGDGVRKIGRLSPNEINDFIKNKKSNHQ